MESENQENHRRRLIEIDDELRFLPADAFTRKFELQSEADELRAVLAELMADDLDDASKMWAEQAGRKGEHEQATADEGVARLNVAHEFGGGNL